MVAANAQRGTVVLLADAGCPSHQQATLQWIAAQVAMLKAYAFSAPAEPRRDRGPQYFVPADTLSVAQAEQLGIRSERDFLGGVVPFPFVATKAITHCLVAPDAAAPPGWNPQVGDALTDAVLPGFTAFSGDDLRRAGELLLRTGPIRLKATTGVGGRGQQTLAGSDELAAWIAGADADALARDGVVVELDLESIDTLSVGRVHCAELVISYVGRQRLTTNHRGESVYGGSDLQVIRGELTALEQLALSEPQRLAVSQALRYDMAARATFPALLASRRNYDVARGLDRNGAYHSGVLEQSWRVGGATPAEIAALRAFAADSSLRAVRASTHEVYALQDVPATAEIYFRGVDERVGALTKYCLVTDYAHSSGAS